MKSYAIIGTGAIGTAFQGRSVDISTNGNTAIVGGPYDNGQIGAAWIFFNPLVGIQPISNILPKSFSLSQNYPNPFNPSTKIKFSIPGSSVAQTFLSVYDILGKEITTLVNEQLKPGSYEVEWNAANYPSGVYYYKLTSGDFTETKKMVLIK